MSKMISMTEDGYVLCSDNITAVEYINITLSVQMQMFQQIMKEAPTEHADEIKAELYDVYNQAASEFLAAFAPEIELRPDLTAEAILKAENEILSATPVSEETESKVISMKEHIKSKAADDNLIPLDALDTDGKPKKPVHK